MDANTLILTLAFGSYVFAFLLFLFQYGKEPSRRIPFWITAKFLQGTGSLILYYCDIRSPSSLNLAADALLLVGCAYEGWAVFHIIGRTVSRRLHLSATGAILTVCLLMVSLLPSLRLSVNFLMHSVFYVLPGWALLCYTGKKSLLRAVLGYSFLLVAGVFLTRSLWILLVPGQSFSGFGAVIAQIMLPTVYYMMLISGFSMLLLAKENSDRELHDTLLEQQAILETLPTGLAIVRDRVIERCNPSLEQMFGHPPGTLIGRNVHCLYESDVEFDRYGHVINEIELLNRYHGEIKAVRPTGERFWTWVEGRSIFPERSQRHAVFSITDITQQKQQQGLLVLQKEELQAATHAKNRFIQMVSHEFRTPFGLLTSSADILDRYWDRLTSTERTAQNHRIRDGVQQINTLINSIFAYNLSDTEFVETAPERVDVGAICHKIATDAAAVWSGGHSFQLTIAEECGEMLLDEVLFRRIVQNLLSNAFNYTEPDGRVRLTLTRQGNSLTLEVADSGIGIDGDDQQRIFDEYFRGHNIGARRGLGLGLSIVHDAVTRLKGTIRAESAPGKGTTMRVEIPANR